MIPATCLFIHRGSIIYALLTPHVSTWWAAALVFSRNWSSFSLDFVTLQHQVNINIDIPACQYQVTDNGAG